MKTRLTVLGLLFAFAFSFAQEESTGGMQFFKGTFEDAKAQAQAEGKLIFVDAYAVWCGPCKRMSSTVFPNEEVGKVYNQYYISLKIDMEKPMGLAFGKNYPVQAYPTLFYMDAEGNILEKVVGGRSVEDFIALGQKFSSKATPGGVNYSKKYDEGDRSAETVYHYIAQMNRSGKNILPVVNEFLRKQTTSWESEWELRFLYEASVESDSKVFETFLARKKALEKYYTSAELEERIVQACLRTAVKAAEFDYPDLLEKAKAIVKENAPRRYKSVHLQADLLYAAETQDSKAFVKHMGDVEKTFEDEPAILIALAEKAEKSFSSHPQISEKVLSWMEKALKKEETAAGYFKLAQLYYKKGNVSAAREKALKALQIAESKKENTFPIESFIQRLEKS
jgi:thiol-disulfide isomerase/thioredoxin